MGKVDDVVVGIVSRSRRLEMTLPGVELTIFLERLVIRNTALCFLQKIVDGRVDSGKSSGCRSRSRSSGKRHSRLSTPGPE